MFLQLYLGVGLMKKSYPDVIPTNHNNWLSKISLVVRKKELTFDVTNSCLIGLKTCMMGGNSYLVLYT